MYILYLFFVQALTKWFQTPVVTANDSNMAAMCMKIIGKLCLSEELSWQMIDKNGLMAYLEDGGLLYSILNYHPRGDILVQILLFTR